MRENLILPSLVVLAVTCSALFPLHAQDVAGKSDEGAAQVDAMSAREKASAARSLILGEDGELLIRVPKDVRVRLREAPPSGFLNLPGKERDVVGESEFLKVTEKKEIRTLFGKYDYAHVQRFCKKGAQCLEKEGWIYLGKSDQNFVREATVDELYESIFVEDDPGLQRYLATIPGAEYLMDDGKND